MRLIDRDKLEKDGWYLSRNYHQDLQTCVYETKKISDVPIVDAAPVKHGKWINDNDLYKCTACNDLCTVAGWANCISEKQMYKVFKYCPNCGARMDAKDDESHPFADSVMMGD